MTRNLEHILKALSFACFACACGLVGCILIVVSYDMTSRNFGLPTAVWSVNSVEYMILFVTFLVMPWLVRTRGHVSVTIVLQNMPDAVRHLFEKFLHVFAAVICFHLAWRAGLRLEDAIARGAVEIRSFDMPLWIVYVTMPVGLGLSGLEFLAFLYRGESFYDAHLEEAAGL
ncbi:TRAP transporter small permease [Paracoccus sp. (in: a-proteobacteria)]|uniref:TRAP transporter small permease n=1 Tax=Paracoccus sp. TaxID=267 RepID=UPI003A87FA77